MRMRSDIAFPEDMGEKGSVDKIEVMAETAGDEAKQDHSSNFDEYDPSLDMPICSKDRYQVLHKKLLL